MAAQHIIFKFECSNCKAKLGVLMEIPQGAAGFDKRTIKCPRCKVFCVISPPDATSGEAFISTE